MQRKTNDGAIAASLLLSVCIWGANNSGVKVMVQFVPPTVIGSIRFFLAGLIFLALLRWTPLFGKSVPLSPQVKARLWWRTGLSLALYVITFNWALRKIPVSHVALYLGSTPVWALLWEGQPAWDWKSAQRYGAAGLAFCGVLILMGPALRHGKHEFIGEICGLSASVLWTSFGRQCHALGDELSGAQITAHTFLRSAILLIPCALLEAFTIKMTWRNEIIWLQLFSILFGGVLTFALWTNALGRWKTSRVYLFNNIVPFTTMASARIFLGEPITPTFWYAMIFIGAGVLLGQTNLLRLRSAVWQTPE